MALGGSFRFGRGGATSHGLASLASGAKRNETAYFAELTYAEVAAQLNEPVGTINTGDAGGDRTAPNDVWI